jgi:hypothetical protein
LLHEDVEDDAVGVDGPPQPVTLALDLELHFVQMPFIARACSPPPQSHCITWAELGHHARLVMQIMGRSQVSMLKRYRHVLPGLLDDAALRLERVLPPTRSAS